MIVDFNYYNESQGDKLYKENNEAMVICLSANGANGADYEMSVEEAEEIVKKLQEKINHFKGLSE